MTSARVDKPGETTSPPGTEPPRSAGLHLADRFHPGGLPRRQGNAEICPTSDSYHNRVLDSRHGLQHRWIDRRRDNGGSRDDGGTRDNGGSRHDDVHGGGRTSERFGRRSGTRSSQLILQRDDFAAGGWTLTPIQEGPPPSPYSEFDDCAYLEDFDTGGPFTAEARSFEATSDADRTTVDSEGRLYADETTAREQVMIWGDQQAVDCGTKRLASNFDRLVDNGVLEGWSGRVDHEINEAADGTTIVKYTIALGLSFTDGTDDTQILSQYRFQVGRATYRLNFSNPDQEYPQREQQAFLDLLISRAADAGIG